MSQRIRLVSLAFLLGGLFACELDEVTELYRSSGNDIAQTAEKLEVDPSAYSKEKVTSAIDQAKATAMADAKQKAADGVDKAGESLGEALGGLRP